MHLLPLKHLVTSSGTVDIGSASSKLELAVFGKTKMSFSLTHIAHDTIWKQDKELRKKQRCHRFLDEFSFRDEKTVELPHGWLL